MKKFNLNSILFIFAAVFVLGGIWGDCFTKVKWGIFDALAAIKHFDLDGVKQSIDTINTASSEYLIYHDTMMDVDSVRNNLLGTRVIFKDDTTVVKTDSGTLIEARKERFDTEIEAAIEQVQKLQKVAENNGAEFLYCIAPRKEYYAEAPVNVDNFSKKNQKAFLALMNEGEIPVLDFTEMFLKNGISGKDIFFDTDHHWKAQYGLMAAGAICDELSRRYGFSYNEDYADISNYNVETYPDWFLGSYGKKVGTYFSWKGADDFELITPKFETSLVEEQPLKNQTREGSFEDTVLYLSKMEKNYYHQNPYAVYSGGDHRLQIIKNKLNEDGKKVLIIRDSFACVVTPFLALQTNELHICDMRDFIAEEKMNMADYIQEIKPDYVIVLYSGVSGAEPGGRFDFFD